jgi:hypothetical protein
MALLRVREARICVMLTQFRPRKQTCLLMTTIIYQRFLFLCTISVQNYGNVC